MGASAGRILSEWKGDDGRDYRLRVMRGEALIDRRLSERGPWRPMPYPRALSNRIAELTAGRQWREVPMPKEEKACSGSGTWPGDPCLCEERS